MSENEVRARLGRARAEVEVARLLLRSEYPAPAASRAYYAVFYAAEAALRALGETRSSHAGLIAAFGKLVVKEGGFDREIGAALNALFELRNEADYDLEAISEQEVEEAVREAERFVDAVEAWIRARRRPR